MGRLSRHASAEVVTFGAQGRVSFRSVATCCTPVESATNGFLHRDHGSEDLSSRHPHVVRHAGEHGRIHEETLRQTNSATSADHRRRAFLAGEIEIAEHSVELRLRNERASSSCRVEWITRWPSRDRRTHRLHERVVVLPRDQHPGLGGARLTGVADRQGHEALQRVGDVGVVEHDGRRLPAQLEAYPGHVRSSGGHDPAAGGRRPCCR